MSDPTTSLYYAIAGEVVWVKIVGRANCVVGVEFLHLVQQLRSQQSHHFALALRECVLMDSSFLGVLAGLEQEFGNRQFERGQADGGAGGPNPRVSDLIANLGLNEYFKLRTEDGCCPDQWIPVPPSSSRTSRLLCSKMSLDAHEVIVRLNPANESKFRGVLDCLKDDVRRLGEGQK